MSTIQSVMHENRVFEPSRDFVAQANIKKADCDALKDWRSAGFAPGERAALAYADERVQRGQVSDQSFDALRAQFDEREIAELTVLIGSYIMHNRVFGALQVDVEATP